MNRFDVVTIDKTGTGAADREINLVHVGLAGDPAIQLMAGTTVEAGLVVDQLGIVDPGTGKPIGRLV